MLKLSRFLLLLLRLLMLPGVVVVVIVAGVGAIYFGVVVSLVSST